MDNQAGTLEAGQTYTFYHELDCCECRDQQLIPVKKHAEDMPEADRECLIKTAAGNGQPIWPFSVSQTEMAAAVAQGIACRNVRYEQTNYGRRLHTWTFVRPRRGSV